MPAYNAADYIEKAIRSVLDQTYDNLCLIIVNDGSTDQTSNILSNFLNEKRIKIITQNNTGIAGAYKKAFEYIDGDYVMFLDSDDALAPNTLKELSVIATQSHSDIMQFGISYFDVTWSHKRDLVFQDKEIVSCEEILVNYFSGINNGTDRPNLGIRAYKKELLLDFVFPPIGSLGIDEILNLFCMTRCRKITFISKSFYLCQQRVNSVSRIKSSIKKVAGVLLSYEEMEKILMLRYPEYTDLLYVKFAKFYISHLNIIKRLPTYATNKKDFSRYLDTLRKSSRVKLDVKVKLRMFFLDKFPFLSIILSKN